MRATGRLHNGHPHLKISNQPGSAVEPGESLEVGFFSFFFLLSSLLLVAFLSYLNYSSNDWYIQIFLCLFIGGSTFTRRYFDTRRRRSYHRNLFYGLWSLKLFLKAHISQPPFRPKILLNFPPLSLHLSVLSVRSHTLFMSLKTWDSEKTWRIWFVLKTRNFFVE